MEFKDASLTSAFTEAAAKPAKQDNAPGTDAQRSRFAEYAIVGGLIALMPFSAVTAFKDKVGPPVKNFPNQIDNDPERSAPRPPKPR